MNVGLDYITLLFTASYVSCEMFKLALFHEIKNKSFTIFILQITS